MKSMWRWAFWLCLAGVLTLSLLGQVPDAVPTTGWDKTNHLLGFAVLGVLGCLAYSRHVGRVMLGLMAYGGLIEILQSFTPNRFAEWGDLLADALGLAIGWVLAWVIFRTWRSLREG